MNIFPGPLKKEMSQTDPLDEILAEFYQRKGLTPSNRCISCSAIYFSNVAKDPSHKRRRKLYMKNYYQNNKDKW